MVRELVSKPFNAGDPTPVAVIVETHDNGTVVEYPLPAPRIVLHLDKSEIIADGTDEATITATFEACALVVGGLAWAAATPTGDVSFTTNLRPTAVTIDSAGQALLALSTTVAGTYRVSASFAGYEEAYTVVEAIV